MVRGIKVMEEDWDYLIILDACRYDYFSKLYGEYFVGRLEKAISRASFTVDWCNESFPDRYDDVVYISANPFVNSKVEAREHSRKKGFSAKDHFHRVIDVWDWGWSNRLGTVHPEQVNRAALSSRNEYPSKRFIIHYLQPHEPYIGCKFDSAGFPRPQLRAGELHGVGGFRELSEETGEKALFKMPRLLKWGLHNLDRLTRIVAKDMGPFGGYPSWRIKELLNLPPSNPMDSVRRKAGITGLRQAYTENLKLVLKFAAALAENLSGTIIITSDHGERLGEGGRYSHIGGFSDPLLLDVPWFKVDKVTNSSHEFMKKEVIYASAGDEKMRIKERLRSLGYT